MKNIDGNNQRKKTSGHINFGKRMCVFNDNTRKSQNIVSKHRRSLNVGKIYMECHTLVFEKDHTPGLTKV